MRERQNRKRVAGGNEGDSIHEPGQPAATSEVRGTSSAAAGTLSAAAATSSTARTSSGTKRTASNDDPGGYKANVFRCTGGSADMSNVVSEDYMGVRASDSAEQGRGLRKEGSDADRHGPWSELQIPLTALAL